MSRGCCRCGHSLPVGCPEPELIEGQDEDVLVFPLPSGFVPVIDGRPGDISCQNCATDSELVEFVWGPDAA